MSNPISITQTDTVIKDRGRDEKPNGSIFLPAQDTPWDPLNRGAPKEGLIGQLVKAGETVPGLDIRGSLAKLEGGGEIWLAAARSFTETTPALLETLKSPKAGELPKYNITVHGIKSVCYSLGAREAGDRARELEDRSRAGDFGFVQEKNGNFIHIMEELLDGLNSLLGKVVEKPEKPFAERPDPGILARIREAADNYDIRTLEESIGILENYYYQEDGELVSWLRKQCDVSDFAAVYAAISDRLFPPGRFRAVGKI